VDAGDLPGARASMAQMARRTVGYEARWRYANLLYLAGDTQAAVRQMTQALAVCPGGEMETTLQQALDLEQGDLRALADMVHDAQSRADPERASELEQKLVVMAVAEQDFPAAVAGWDRLLRSHSSPYQAELRDTGASLASRLLTSSFQVSGDAAWKQRALLDAVWRRGVEAGVLAFPHAASASNWVTDPRFEDEGGSPLGWRWCTDCGPWLSRPPIEAPPAARALQLEFHADGPDKGVVARQWVRLPLPGPDGQPRRLELSVNGRRVAGRTDSGLFVRLADARAVLATLPVELHEDWASSSLVFEAPPEDAVLELQVSFARQPGEMPLRGTVQITALRLAPRAQ